MYISRWSVFSIQAVLYLLRQFLVVQVCFVGFLSSVPVGVIRYFFVILFDRIFPHPYAFCVCVYVAVGWSIILATPPPPALPRSGLCSLHRLLPLPLPVRVTLFLQSLHPSLSSAYLSYGFSAFC